jgi:hypothetical protein
MSVLVAATSVLALETAILPRLLGWAGLVFAVLALLKFLTPLATLALLWVVLISVLMLTGHGLSSRRNIHT